MDDLREIRTLLAKPDPSPEAVARRRRQLRDSMHSRALLRRSRWIVVLPVAAAATAAALVIVPGHSDDSPPASAREILLVAATTAERTPEGSGTYWHITVTRDGEPQEEYWYRKDGQFWLKGEGLKGEGKLFRFTKEPQPFTVGPLTMTFDELRSLPADENALYTRLRDKVASADLRTSAGPLSEADKDGAAVEALISLISEAPVTPEVRAAAYRSLAARPGVEDRGETDGGRSLEVPLLLGKGTVVVDPETARLRKAPVWVPLTGGVASTDGGVTIDAEWTDRLPAE